MLKNFDISEKKKFRVRFVKKARVKPFFLHFFNLFTMLDLIMWVLAIVHDDIWGF